jgi:cytoskeletal protein CcmA (bactofilin family)
MGVDIMAKIISYLFVLILLLSAVSALEVEEGEEVYITTAVNENLYTAGGKVSVDAPVDGDIIAFGGEVSINSPIEGLTHVYGGDIKINSEIEGDLISAGGDINVNKNISGDVSVMGGNINIMGDVEGDLLALGGNIDVRGNIDGDVVVRGGRLILNDVEGDVEFKGGEIKIRGIVKGNVKAEADVVELTDDALIEGNLTFTSESKTVLEREQVKGSMFKKTVKKKPRFKKVNFRIFSGLALLLLGIVLVLIMPLMSRRLADNIKQKFGKSLLFGLLALIVTPIAAVLIAITVIGIPITIILMILYIIAIIVSSIFAALYIGRLIFKKKKLIVQMILGVIIYVLLTNIPYIGGLVKLLAILLGLGAITLVVFSKKKGKKR